MPIGTGTSALVTGASRGIGRAVAAELARRGARVGLVARSQEDLAALAAELPGGPHPVLPADIGERASIAAALDAFGPLDLLVVNAGIAHYGPYADLTEEHEEAMVRVNVLGTLHTVRAALAHLAPGAHVVIVSSGAALRTFPQAAVYGATKAFQRGYADALRHELHERGVSLTTVFPGEIATALHDHEKERMPAWYRGDAAAAPAADMARAIVDGVDADRRYVFFPPIVRLLGIAQGIAPRVADALLRRMRGPTAAPRRR